MRRAAVLIADDHPLVSQGLRALLRPNFVVVGVVNDGREVLNQIEATKPDIVLLDLSMPHRNGLELIPDVARQFPDVRILVVTMHVDRALADLALQGGAHGFIPKEASADELNNAIDTVLGGKPFISPRIPRRSFRDGAAVEHPGLDRLTPRHLQILRLIGDGKSTGQIAEELGVSPRTVEFHRASIRKALGITTEWGLIRYAIVLRVTDDLESEEVLEGEPAPGATPPDAPGSPQLPA
jgi:two-component system, NarL family, nitrate/nitrite response regulator NarL